MGLMEQEVQGLTEGLESVAAVFEGHVESLSGAIAGYVEQAELSNVKESLRKQLKQLIAASSNWNMQLKTEISSQQQLIDSIGRLEGKLSGIESGGVSESEG